MEKRYLGDAVYLEPNGYGVILTTSDGIQDTNTIVLEPAVIVQLLRSCRELPEMRGAL